MTTQVRVLALCRCRRRRHDRERHGGRRPARNRQWLPPVPQRQRHAHRGAILAALPGRTLIIASGEMKPRAPSDVASAEAGVNWKDISVIKIRSIVVPLFKTDSLNP